MALEKCNTAVAEALGRELTDREKRIVSARAGELAARITRIKDPNAIATVLQGFADDVKMNAELRKRTAALNYLAYSKVKAWRQRVQFAKDNPAEAFQAMMRGSLRNFDGAKDSLAVDVQREAGTRSGALTADLEKAGLRDYAYSGTDDRNINRAWADLKEGRVPNAAKYGKNAVTVAKIYDEHLEALRVDHNQAGAWIARAADRTFRRSHDANKIAKAGGNNWGSDASRAAWVDHVNGKLDWERAFDGEFANLTEGARKETLTHLWNDFKDNIHWTPGEPSPPVGLGVGSYSKRLSHGRQLIFRNPDDELAYFQTYGTGSSLAENVFHNLSGGGRDLALMRRLGPNPRATMDRIVSDWKAELDQPGNQDKRAAFQSKVDSEMNNTWRLLTEGAGHPNDNFVGRFAGAVRGVTNTAAIGMSVFALPGDLALRARMVSQASGEGYTRSFLKASAGMMGAGEKLTKSERFELFSELGLRTESAHLPLDPHLVDSVGFGQIAKFNQQVMGVTGHSWWDNRFRLNSLVADGYRHWTLRGKSFDQLHELQQASMQQFGIGAKEWDILRGAKATELSTGTHVFMPSDIAAVDLGKFRSIAGADASEAQLTRARNDLTAKYRNYMGELSDRSVSAPSIAQKALMGLGYKNMQAGTVLGELTRGAVQLKGWAVNYMRNHLGAELYGYDNQMKSFGQAMKDTLTGGNNRGLAGLGKLIAGGVVVAGVTNALKDLANGKMPENPLSADAIERAFARQSLGLYSDFLLQDIRPDASIWDRIGRMAGPEIGLGADIGESIIKLSAQLKSARGLTTAKLNADTQQWFDTLYRNTPGTSVFWAKHALDYFVLDNVSEMLNPGYKQRLIKRMQKQGRTFLPGMGP